MRRFNAIWHWSGSAYTDVTASLGSGSASRDLAAGEKLYFASTDWLSGILLFIGAASSPSIVAETYDGETDEWKELAPAERFDQLATGHSIEPAGYDYSSSGMVSWGRSPWLWTLKRGTSSFPEDSTPPVEGMDYYWVRLRNAGATTVTVDRALPSMYNTYTDAWKVARYMGLPDFDDFDAPMASTVRDLIRAAEDWFEQRTRKTWRLRQVINERHQFNPYGVHLDVYPVLFVTSVGIWMGSSHVDMTEGRQHDWFVSPDTGMLYFTAPSFRLGRYSRLNRYATQPDSLQISYVAGADFEASDKSQAIAAVINKRVGADLILMLDWTTIMTNNPDAVPKPDKARMWREEAEADADELRGLLLQ